MAKKIDINKAIYDLVNHDDKLKEDLIGLGFKNLSNPLMLKTMGKKMSIRRGAKMVGIDNVDKKLEDLGYEIVNSYDDLEVKNRRNLIKSYVKRLSEGEDLQSVRKDFVKNFENVSSSEIMDAEEALLEGGVDRADVQRLCDVHSSLFHGKTESEDGKDLKLINISGHPLRFFFLENEKIKELIDLGENSQDLEKIKDISNKITSHYRKKGDLIYPLLKENYKKPGPSEIMWGVDIEISKNFKKAFKKSDFDDVKKVFERAREMTYKEENILYPLMEDVISNEDFLGLYDDLKDYPDDIIKKEIWDDGENTNNEKNSTDGYINFSKGKMKVDELEALLDTLEIEITFVDKNDINAYYNNIKSEKIFKRAKTSLGREVYSCHPPQVEPIVRKLIGEFKKGSKDKFQIIKNIKGNDHAVTYYAVRDKNGNYLGVLETVQDLSFYKSYLDIWDKAKKK